jgi:hypothetical protein
MRILLIALLLTACGDPSPSNGSASPYAAQIREQVEKANRIALKHGYAPIQAPTVEVLPSDPRCPEASFMLNQAVTPGTNYDQGPFDKDDRPGFVAICVAGRFTEPNKIQTTAEAIQGGYGVWFEMEHAILFQRDRAKYIATMYHNAENLHPILGE